MFLKCKIQNNNNGPIWEPLGNRADARSNIHKKKTGSLKLKNKNYM